MEKLRDFVNNNEVFIVAHRGSSGTAPENTFAAFSQAIDAGAKVIETDVQFTTDGEIIAIHDISMMRTLDGSELQNTMSYHYLKNLDAGSWFDPVYSNERIPLLKDILEFVKDRAYLIIELKAKKKDIDDQKVEKIIGLIDDAGMNEHILLASFNHDLLSRFKFFNSNLPTAAIKIPRDKTLPSELSEKIGCEAYICSLNELSQEMIDDARAHNIYTGVYSIDNKKHWEALKPFKVNAVATNFPAKLKKLMLEDNVL